ncbi:glycogen/starch/alpha-glucan phosphorylase, partial [Devosia sp.]|uniref:glycogen/starch/alpha-glucan phosphorylase n=1 Tax=Devosia sp. TaxID=1871048 RepID=UPI001AC4C1D0
AMGLYGYRMLEKEDPGKIIYSFTLSELTPGGAKFRIQADNFDQPLDINRGTKLDLGSTAKLRTLVTYLEIIEELHRHIRDLQDAIPIAFLPEYDMSLARTLVSGADIWLNTPLPPLEASGTSGMKAALNGVLNLSVLDGWWVEACVEGVTGWAIEGTPPGAGDAEALYRKLADVVLPLYQDRARWVWMMKQSISKIGSTFNSQRMMRRYAAEAYMR